MRKSPTRPRTPRRGDQRKRSRPAVQLSWVVAGGTAPYDVEMTLRRRGVRVWGQSRKSKSPPVAAISVSADQRRWAEEILFVQMGLTPGPGLALQPETQKRMATRGPYQLRNTWQDQPQAPVGVKGRLFDLIAAFSGRKRGR